MPIRDWPGGWEEGSASLLHTPWHNQWWRRTKFWEGSPWLLEVPAQKRPTPHLLLFHWPELVRRLYTPIRNRVARWCDLTTFLEACKPEMLLSSIETDGRHLPKKAKEQLTHKQTLLSRRIPFVMASRQGEGGKLGHPNHWENWLNIRGTKFHFLPCPVTKLQLLNIWGGNPLNMWKEQDLCNYTYIYLCIYMYSIIKIKKLYD